MEGGNGETLSVSLCISLLFDIKELKNLYYTVFWGKLSTIRPFLLIMRCLSPQASGLQTAAAEHFTPTEF